jgi:rSAM/selenodomain-associated transferase 1
LSAPRRLLLYTKPAVPGRVKTRLTTVLTAEQAADVHRAFVGDVVERLGRGEFDLRIAWALRADEEIPGADLLPRPVPGFRQEGRDLGERLFRGLRTAARLDGGARAVAAFGSDHPMVRLETLHEAFGRVEAGADAVLGPSLDGGYHLIVLAAGAVRPELFEGIDWSTGRVLAQTRERIGTAGLRLETVAEALDVDTPEDLDRLAEELAAAEPGFCPRTRRVLDALGRWH